MQELRIKSPTEFALQIEEMVWKHDISYMEAIVMYCTTSNVEIETVATLIKLNANMKSKLQTEAENLNYLPKIARLPV